MNTLKTILSGLAVGGAMTIPGVSGGSAAMILGIYDDLITAVSRAFSEPRKNLLLLLKFAVGACAGALLIARLITFLRIRCGDKAVSRWTSACGGAGAPGDKRVALSAYARDLR